MGKKGFTVLRTRIDKDTSRLKQQLTIGAANALLAPLLAPPVRRTLRAAHATAALRLRRRSQNVSLDGFFSSASLTDWPARRTFDRSGRRQRMPMAAPPQA